MRFLVDQMLARARTCTPVEVVAVTNSGGVSAVGFVDVQPMINQADGSGRAVPHAVIYRLPYLRIQGGANAVIIDPQKGDIGLACFSDRDASVVKNTKAQGNPGSNRRHSMSDGFYIGGFLNAQPTQYIQFVPGGINVYSPTAINVTAPAINIGSNGGTLHQLVTDALEALFNGHTHPIPGGGSTSATNTPMSSAQLTSVLKAD